MDLVSDEHECINIDKLLDIYQTQKDNVIKAMYNNINNFVEDLWNNNLLSWDRSCCCAMGINDTNNIELKVETTRNLPEFAKRKYMCFQCASLRNIVDLYVENLGKPFRIECGRLKDHQLIVIHNNYTAPKLSLNDKPVIFKNVGCHKSFTQCKSHCCKDLSNRNYLASDYFSNHVLVSWLVEQELIKSGLNNYATLYTAFICNHQSYLLKEWLPYDWVTLSSNKNNTEHKWFTKLNETFVLNPNLFSSAINQICKVMLALQPSNFISFNITDDLFKVDHNFKFYLSNIKKAGININNTRIYYHDRHHDKELNFADVNNYLNTITYSNNKEYVRMNDLGRNYMRRTIDFFYTAQMGLVEYAYVVQYYLYLLYFFKQPIIYPLMWHDMNVYNIFARMWVTADLEQARSDFVNLLKKPEVNKYDLLHFLCKRTLKINLLSTLISLT